MEAVVSDESGCLAIKARDCVWDKVEDGELWWTKG